MLVGVSLSPRLIAFIQPVPEHQHTRCGGRSDSQSATRGKDSPKNDPTMQLQNANYNQIANINGIKGIPRASSSGDQGDSTTKPHRSPNIECHTTKTRSESR